MWDYQPSDDDVVRARLRTMGVQEHRFIFEKGTSLCVDIAYGLPTASRE